METHMCGGNVNLDSAVIINYYANDGTESVVSELIPLGEDYIILAETCSRDGYAFIGWNTKQSGSGTTYLPHEVIKSVSSDAHLYAQWKRKNGPDWVNPLGERYMSVQ